MTAGRHVLVVLHDELLNGASISVLRALPLLEERGWSFAFWVPQPGAAADLLRARGYRVHGEPKPVASGLRALREPPGLSRRIGQTPGYLRRFKRALREEAPAVVHANSLYSFAEAAVAKRAGCPTLIHLHDMAPRSRKARLAREVVRRGADLAIAASHACANSYAEGMGGWQPEVVYEAAPVPPAPAELRPDPSPFVIGTVGVLAPRKGGDLFVEAAEMVLAERGGAVAFAMIGAPTDPLERDWGERVLRRARAAGIRHHPEADVSSQLRQWDAFALPSRYDPCPIALLEAMAHGLPVIGSRVDGIPEQIVAGTGLLVDSEDAGELARAMLDLISKPFAERTAMGAAGRARVEEVFSLERQADALDARYRELARSSD